MSLFREHSVIKQGWIAVRIVLLLVKMSLFWNTAALDRGGKPSAYFGNSVALVRNETLKCRHCVFVPAKNDTVVIGKLSDSEVIYKIILKSQLWADKWGLLRLEDWVSGIYSTVHIGSRFCVDILYWNKYKGWWIWLHCPKSNLIFGIKTEPLTVRAYALMQRYICISFIYLLLLPLQSDRILLGVDLDYFWYCTVV